MTKEDFAIKDYELKIGYLKDHLSRMWQRFNYMMGIQTAIAGGRFFLDPKDLDMAFGSMGLLFGVLWYVLGAHDRYLFELYRKQVANAFEYIDAEIAPKDRSFVGQVYEAIEVEQIQSKRNITTWRWDSISSTKMAAIVPLVVTVLWAVYLCLSKQ